jgi:DNA polymerase-3 subunit chi
MTAIIQFYHLTTSPLERALPKLLERIVAGGFKVSLVTGSAERAEQLNQLLWTYDPGSFLPHGSSADGNGEEQPIYISTAIDAPNHANVLVLSDGRSVDAPDNFERVVDMFDGTNEATLTSARARWTHYKNAGHALTYFKQTDSGGWEKAA